MCKQNPSWFIAAQQNDVEKIKQLMKKNKNSLDKRETSQADSIYKGFGAIHYACLFGHEDLVKTLMVEELALRTKDTVMFPAPGFSDATKYRLASNSSCLDIALLSKKPEIVKLLVEKITQDKIAFEKLIGKVNHFNLTTLIVAGLCNYQEAFDVMNNEQIIDKELHLVTSGDVTLATNCAYFGRIQCALMLERCAKNPKLNKFVFEMMLKRDMAKLTVLEITKQEVDLVKFNCTQGQRQEIENIIKELTTQAYEYAVKQTDKKWQGIVIEFLAGKTPAEMGIEVTVNATEGLQPVLPEIPEVAVPVQEEIKVEPVQIEEPVEAVVEEKVETIVEEKVEEVPAENVEVVTEREDMQV
ncbi:Ankyrin_repeat protein 1 [Hexamita inflata]|uniref:Ankyrin repeat protein 1 n=1 Tax=Hexamita inflata TaxID=28002 RepID=A0AA86P9Z4_9EUKA|nr:Ankyrin repeat protein 1 [Hexamita inflata]